MSIRRTFVIAAIASLVASYVTIWVRFVHDPAERTGLDFIAFFAAGRTAQTEGAGHVYDPRFQQDFQEEQVGFPLAPGQVLLYNHMPFLIPILQATISANYVASLYRWALLLLIVYILGIAVLSRSLQQTGIDRNSIWSAAVGGLLFLPIFFSLVTGQDTAFLFLGTATWVYGLHSGREMLSGIGLSLTTVRPHIALLFALAMLFRYPKVFWAFATASAALAIVSLLIVGIEGGREFIDVLRLSAGGTWYGMKEDAMYNLIGLLNRFSPGLPAGSIRTIGWLVYGMTIIGLCAFWARIDDPQTQLTGLTVTLALFVAPHLHFHDLALLLVPIYEMVRSGTRTGGIKTSIAVMFPVAISLLLLLSNTSPDLRYTIPYLIMLTLAVYRHRARFNVPVSVTPRS